MKRISILGVACCLLAATFYFSTQAQVQEVRENTGAAAAWRALLRLRTTATVLHTTAHPDDEDGAMLTWLTRHEGVRTGLLTLNRGEGGANVIGAELYDQLGIVRTEELLAAGRYYGVDQMFTRVTDFGFSKRMDETIEHWGKEVVLKDVVHAVRLYRPDIIISRFHGKPRDGHGNHQAAGLLSGEVFKAAADPKMFPEQFQEGLRPWQVKKLYRSVGGFGGGGRNAEPQEATVKVDVGAYDPLLGRSYLQIARYGLGFQRSQNGGGSLAAPGSSISSWFLEESLAGKRQTEASVFEGLDTTILGLAKLAGSTNLTPELTALNSSIEAAIQKFDARQPWLTATDLAAGKKTTQALIEKVKASSIAADNKDQLLFLLGNKESEFNDAMNKALGLVMAVLVDPPQATGGGPGGGFGGPRETFTVAIPDQQFTLTATVVNRSQQTILQRAMLLQSASGWGNNVGKLESASLGNNQATRVQFTVKVPLNAEYSRPYWSRANHLREHIYQINKPEYLHLPFAPPELTGVFNYEVNGVNFSLSQPAQTTYVDRPWGEQRRLLTVAPALSVALSPQVGVVSIGATNASFNASVNVMNNVKGTATGKVRLKLPTGWTSAPAEAPFSFTHEGELANFAFKITVPRVAAGQDYKVQAVAEYAGKEYVEGYEVIAHRDNEPRHLYHPATMEVRGIETNVAPNLNVGYVMGVGDEIPKALEQIGVKVTLLNENDLAKSNLDGYDAILIGIRATAVRDDLKAYSKRLLEYCERGGNLVYQYQTQEFDGAPYGPYPYKLGARAEEVSEEDSKVTLLDPNNPIFNWPNKISEADFNGWVEERGSKWMSTWDDKYVPLLEGHDREQAPQKGGLMYAQYGKGTFVYAAYAFYRQLPAGVQGGYRLFSNIISLKKRPR